MSTGLARRWNGAPFERRVPGAIHLLRRLLELDYDDPRQAATVR